MYSIDKKTMSMSKIMEVSSLTYFNESGLPVNVTDLRISDIKELEYNNKVILLIADYNYGIFVSRL